MAWAWDEFGMRKLRVGIWSPGARLPTILHTNMSSNLKVSRTSFRTNFKSSKCITNLRSVRCNSKCSECSKWLNNNLVKVTTRTVTSRTCHLNKIWNLCQKLQLRIATLETQILMMVTRWSICEGTCSKMPTRTQSTYQFSKVSKLRTLTIANHQPTLMATESMSTWKSSNLTWSARRICTTSLRTKVSWSSLGRFEGNQVDGIL